FIQAKLHTQEWEHLLGFFCMLAGQPPLHANVARDSLSFVTKAMPKPDEAVTKMLSNSRNVAAGSSDANRVRADNFALEHTDRVPIYDARGVDGFDINTDLDKLEDVLPPFNEEIPCGSFTIVGYTAAIYANNQAKWAVSMNIHWAIILSSPSPESDE
ncbi:hypothetical protein BKA70DRAFT_1107349, partial [Coprinopsis sp. MPI-PUGE-AT-0042]